MKNIKWQLWRICIFFLLLTKKTGFGRWELSLSCKPFYENGYSPIEAIKECSTYEGG
jgi:hypothetical protein